MFSCLFQIRPKSGILFNSAKDYITFTLYSKAKDYITFTLYSKAFSLVLPPTFKSVLVYIVLIYRVSRCVDYDSAKKWCAKICNPFDLCDVTIKIKPESH